MNWKLFLTACVSAALISFPQNIIGCGPDADPYDYYTSFFHQNLPDAKGFRPFYYTGYNFLYDETEPASTTEVLSNEWAVYCGKPVTPSDAKSFVAEYAWKDLNTLYQYLEKNQPLKIPDSVQQNSMTSHFIRSKNLEALGYLMFAKKAEPFVAGGAETWESPVRDSVKMDKLIKAGFQLYNVAKEDFIKQRYLYQVLRLAHYSGRYKEVIEWYDKFSTSLNSTSIIQPLSLALKAGALFRTGQNKEAAYLFSKAFAANDVKRISNFIGFNWSINHQQDREGYLSLCKTNTEKADMLAMFTMNSSNYEIKAMKEVYQLDPSNEMLEVLAVREINKMEEQYLSPLLQKEKGSKEFLFYWTETKSDSALTENSKAAKDYMLFLHEAAAKGLVKNVGLFENGAAYMAFMIKDYTAAKNYLAAASKMKLNQKLKDQWALTNLLVTINEKEKIDAVFEEQLLPSIHWLEAKAITEKPEKVGYDEIQQWKRFYRNLMTDILAARYRQQGDHHKEVLCIGAADFIMKNTSDYYSYSNATDFLHNNLISKDVEKLYALLDDKQPGKFDSYLINHNSLTKTAVVDFAGTAYLRDNDYANAITWFKKSTDKKSLAINTNPFADLLYDRDEQLPNEVKFTTTKLAFAIEMQRLQKLAETDKPNAAKYLYKIANGLYNMTYYGHAWSLVQYYRSGSDGYTIPDNATSFQKEYYGCFKAQEYFEKAMTATADKNFKARCLFMMAKCSQKNIHQPQYGEFGDKYDQYSKAQDSYLLSFKNNKYFPRLTKEFGNTPFYKEAFNSCSYLRDFVKKK
jgi:hypothetical protein